jgi:hypothetical protein
MKQSKPPSVIVALGALLGTLGGLLTVSPALASVPAGAPVRAASASAPVPGWSITPTPNPEVPTGQLVWASCPASNSCMAVGVYVKTSGQGASLAEQWNGSSWRIVRTPNPPGSTFSVLFGVACSTPVACTAVGTSTVAGATQALVERWNGASWHIQKTPNPAQGGAALGAVSCVSSSACMAVGSFNGGTLAEAWNGTRWQVQATPNPASGAFLGGVSCTSASSCTAAGGSSAGTLAERWNGTRWSIQATPNPPQGGGVLTGVSCTSASSCTAVGGRADGTTLAERWNGTQWSIQATPNPPPGNGFLNGVSCTSASSCTATGAANANTPNATTLAERWDGTRWSIQATPNPPPGNGFLNGVSCTTAAACIAVGTSDLNGSMTVLVERLAGSTWRIQAAPSPPGAATSYLNSVWCASPSACLTVGATTSRSRAQAAVAEWWNGRTWRLRPIPSPAGGGGLNSVSCTSLSACTAVGGRTDSAGNIAGTLAERWNGTSWQIQSTPNPAGGGFLSGVSCSSASACTAVGNSNGGKTLAERWDGTRWTIQATPNPASSAPFITLSTVACTSSSACMAVGGKLDNSGNAEGTLAERWNGKNWQIVPTFKPTSLGSFLNGVACTSSAACTAVGDSSQVTTLAERWNGTRWQVQPTPNPPGIAQVVFGNVACPTASVCTAVGVDFTNSGLPLTLAERWDGTGWHIQAAPTPVGAFGLDQNGVACPTVTACIAVGAHFNLTQVTLAEQWTQTGTSTQAATGRPVAPGALPAACLRAHMPGSLPISGRSPAAAWSRSRAGSFLGRAGSPSPTSRVWCRTG